jgi:hypothetical protein
VPLDGVVRLAEVVFRETLRQEQVHGYRDPDGVTARLIHQLEKPLEMFGCVATDGDRDFVHAPSVASDRRRVKAR